MFKSTLTATLGVLGSTRLSVLGFCLLAAGLPLHHTWPFLAPWSIVLPLGFLAINLAAALVADPRFRHKPALFGFHLCLLLVALLAAWGELSGVQARISVIEGQYFEPAEAEIVSRGILSPGLDPLSGIRQGALAVEYGAGLNRGKTRSELQADGTGRLEVGDDIPFKRGGFRVYTTPNKGFAAVLTWLPDQGLAETGALHFPSFPARQIMQTVEWSSPGGEGYAFSLQAPLVDMNVPWVLSRAMAAESRLMLKTDQRRLAMQPGVEVAVRGGRLRLDGIVLWMGYRVSYNPALPWLLVSALLAMLFMAGHFASRPVARQALPAVGSEEGVPCR